MVLTNFECWAHGGSDDLSASLITERRASSVDLFNPTAIDQSCNISTNLNTNNPVQIRSVSHLSSNGYYGFVPCTVDNITPQTNKVPTVEHETNKQNEPVGAPIKSLGNNKCGDDTIMDVEQQEHVIFEHSIKATSDSVVGSMFPQDRNVFAQYATFQTESVNRSLELYRRKRMFVEEDHGDGMRMDCGGVTKRIRYGLNNCVEPSDDNLSARFGNTDTKHSVMEQDDLDVQHSREDNMVLNSPDPPNNTQSMTGRQCNSDNVRVNKTDRKALLNVKLEEVKATPKTLLTPKQTRQNLSKINRKAASPINITNLENPLNPNSNNLYPSDLNIQSKNRNDDHLLENLFLSLHGGSNHHLWQHLSDDMCCDEI